MRNSDSAVFNTAEGAGHFQPGKKIYHYELAKGSAEECKIGLYMLQQLDPRVDTTAARDKADHLCAMLVGLIKAAERRRDSK